MSLYTSVNLIGDFATSPEIQKNKSLIEDIINTITTEICNSDKKNDMVPLISTIKSIIQQKFPNYDKICTKSPKLDGSCDEMVFTDQRINDIINKIRNNTEYRRICKFKYNVINNIITNSLIPKVLSQINYYPIQYFSFPQPFISYHNGYPIIIGGGNKKNNGKYGLGTIKIGGKDESIKFVDFDDFIGQYEKYYTVQNKMFVKTCESINGKTKCTSKIYDLNKPSNYDDDVESNSESEDVNVLTRGKNEKLDEAYKNIFDLKMKNINDLLDRLENLIDYIKYYVLPLNTLEKSEKANAKIVQT
jgi:hypothetical protein